jgi:hypothetical protein
MAIASRPFEEGVSRRGFFRFAAATTKIGFTLNISQ